MVLLLLTFAVEAGAQDASTAAATDATATTTAATTAATQATNGGAAATPATGGDQTNTTPTNTTRVTPTSTPVGDLRLDFSVPDLPALTALGTSPSNVIRPSSVRTLAAALASGITPDGRFQSGLAFELSPFAAAEAQRTWLNNFRVSGGWVTEGTGSALSARAAVGLRWTYARQITVAQQDYGACIGSWVREIASHQTTTAQSPREATNSVTLTGEALVEFNEASTEGSTRPQTPSATADTPLTVPADVVARCRANGQAANLSNMAIEAAAVLSWTSPDARITNFDAMRSTVWLAGAIHIHQDAFTWARGQGSSFYQDILRTTTRHPFSTELDIMLRHDYVQSTSTTAGAGSFFAAVRVPFMWEEASVFIEGGVRFNNLWAGGDNFDPQRMEIPVGLGADLRLGDGTWLGAYLGGNVYEGGTFNPGVLALANLKYNISPNRPFGTATPSNPQTANQ